MFRLTLPPSKGWSPTILCLGAHCDDIEIGCGGTLLTLLDMYSCSTIYWSVFAGRNSLRAREARRSARTFLQNARFQRISVHGFKDGFFPSCIGNIKECFEDLKPRVNPDLVFTHCRHDLHQDHRVVSELTWNTFRDHLILEYEIPKYDGDLASPNVFVPLEKDICNKKVQHILECFPSQRENQWFDKETFMAIMRLRGIESNAPGRFAEAFYCRKMILG